MRILIINSEYPPIGGGAGNASANLARAMAQQGHEIMVMTAQFADLPRSEVKEGVQVERINALRRRADRSSPTEQISFIFGGTFGAIRLVNTWQPDIILAFFGVPSGVIGLCLRWLKRIPYVVSLRGGDVPGFRPYDFAVYHRLAGPFLRVVWHRAGAVVANSLGLKNLAANFDRQAQIEVIPNGVNPHQFSPVERDWNSPKLLFVGRIVYQKGLDILFHALSNLVDLPWEITLVGDGPEFAKLKFLAAQFGLKDRLTFVGWRHNHELIEHYQAANIFINPSRHEGMPNAVLEAMSMALPVIATQISGNEELVIPDETGILIPTDDQDALAQALRVLISDPEKCRQMGLAARQRVLAEYTWQNSAAQYLRLMEWVYTQQRLSR